MSTIAMGRYLRQATHPTTQLMHGIAALFAAPRCSQALLAHWEAHD